MNKDLMNKITKSNLISKLTLYEDNILVTELTDDIVLAGVPVMYDSDSPYMFCKVEAYSSKHPDLHIGDVLVIKRYAKEEYVPGYYFISYKDVRGTMPYDAYEEALVKEEN